MSEIKSPINKAREVNLDTKIYGTFAEIGAGQEVARFFFQAGKASQTIAKTISAYDMIYSDEIYGKESSGRYVCESRVLKMLDKEFSLMQRRLTEKRGDNTCFFAYANTVATGGLTKKYSHGWMGIRFQTTPNGKPNDIVMHVRLLDRHRLQQQETLGVLGVNLVHTAFFNRDNVFNIIPGLVDSIKNDQVAIDYIRFSGPDLDHVNNHLMNLSLVRRGLSDAVLFGPDGNILNISDELFQKAVLIQRGTYRPVTTTHIDVLDKGCKQFQKEFSTDAKKSLVLFELTMHSLEQEDGHIHEKDFLDRVKSLCSLGRHVLVSNFHLFYRLKDFMRDYTEQPMALIVGASHLEKVFDESHYRDLDGGLLEGLGRLLDDKTKLYVYPHKTANSCMTTKSFFPAPKVLKIYQHFIEQKQIQDISGCDEASEYLHSEEVRQMIINKNPAWEKLVPEKIKEQIKKENLFSLI